MSSAAEATELPGLLERLLRTPGPSGYEQDVAAVWREAVAEHADDVATTPLGSVTATLQGAEGAPHLAIFTHIDEIGFLIREVDESGFLVIDGIGGWDPLILLGQRVEIVTANGPASGVIGRKAIHLLTKDEREQEVKLRDLRVDIGAADRADARRRVEVGDAGVIAADPVRLPHGRVVSRSLDNRVSAYIAAQVVARLAAASGRRARVTAVASVQEETTLAGARTSGHGLAPDLAIVIDVTHASDAPGASIADEGEHGLGSGPVISRGPATAPRVVTALREAARAADIPYTLMADGIVSATDADAVHEAASGIPTGIVSIPLRYMHSPVEMVQLSDVDAVIALVVATALAL